MRAGLILVDPIRIIRDEMGYFQHFYLGLSFITYPISDVFLRPTLRGCQCGRVLGGVEALRSLTLSCQKTNPDGVFEPDGVDGGIVRNMGWGC